MTTLEKAFEYLTHLINEKHVGFETAIAAIESQYRLSPAQIAQLRRVFY